MARGSKSRTYGKQTRNHREQEDEVVNAIRAKEVLKEALDLVMAGNADGMKKRLNRASWKVKEILLKELLEQGEVYRANDMATEIIDMTEEKKTTLNANINVSEKVLILQAAIEGVPFDVLAQRADQLRRIGTRAHRDGDGPSGPGEVLLVEGVPVSERSSGVCDTPPRSTANKAAD